MCVCERERERERERIIPHTPQTYCGRAGGGGRGGGGGGRVERPYYTGALVIVVVHLPPTGYKFTILINFDPHPHPPTNRPHACAHVPASKTSVLLFPCLSRNYRNRVRFLCLCHSKYYLEQVQRGLQKLTDYCQI